MIFSFLFHDSATTTIYTLSLRDALPICIFLFNIFDHAPELVQDFTWPEELMKGFVKKYPMLFVGGASSITHMHDGTRDRKSTRLNSSHVSISYAVFCLKKKKKNNTKNLY